MDIYTLIGIYQSRNIGLTETEDFRGDESAAFAEGAAAHSWRRGTRCAETLAATGTETLSAAEPAASGTELLATAESATSLTESLTIAGSAEALP